MNITLQELSALIDARYMERGEQIIEEGSVVLQDIKPDSISAYAVGRSTYLVKLFRENKKLAGTCTCPALSNFGPCKHMAATGLVRLAPGYHPDEFCVERTELFDAAIKRLSKKNNDILTHKVMVSIGKS